MNNVDAISLFSTSYFIVFSIPILLLLLLQFRNTVHILHPFCIVSHFPPYPTFYSLLFIFSHFLPTHSNTNNSNIISQATISTFLSYFMKISSTFVFIFKLIVNLKPYNYCRPWNIYHINAGFNYFGPSV